MSYSEMAQLELMNAAAAHKKLTRCQTPCDT